MTHAKQIASLFAISTAFNLAGLLVIGLPLAARAGWLLAGDIRKV